MEVSSTLLIGITNRDIFIVCNMMEGGALDVSAKKIELTKMTKAAG